LFRLDDTDPVKNIFKKAMSELRFNPIAREWVIIAKERAKRPEFYRTSKGARQANEYSSWCPFCPGNEEATPEAIIRVPQRDKWKIRVIPSKFPAVFHESETQVVKDGLKYTMNGVGRHEIIIETPNHKISTAFLNPEDLTEILDIYKSRFMEAYKDTNVAHVIIFKNHGPSSGSSILHSHTQLIAFPIKPSQVKMRIEEGLIYYKNTGKCLMCETIRDEQQDVERIIHESEHFMAFVPFAALSPFHLWIFPKRHASSFADIKEEEIKDLAVTLKIILLKLYNGLDNPDFNYVLRSEGPKPLSGENFHWYISIVPRVIDASGIELGSGVYVNLSIPEESAEFLRNVKIEY
jgi:UDPglucose--hexose-1-phosphate uridylyltransferase